MSNISKEIDVDNIRSKLDKLKKLSENNPNKNEAKVAKKLYDKLFETNKEKLKISKEEYDLLNEHVLRVDIVDNGYRREVIVESTSLEEGLLAIFKARKNNKKVIEGEKDEIKTIK